MFCMNYGKEFKIFEKCRKCGHIITEEEKKFYIKENLTGGFYYVRAEGICKLLPKKPKRVWTLIKQKSLIKGEFVPVHNKNAFVEDYIHDWDWNEEKKILRYYSRIAKPAVWIYCQFDK